jgi:hypothetical protein
MKFVTNNKTHMNLNTGYDNNTSEEIRINKLLYLQTDSKLNWKNHIVYIIPKLISGCFAMRSHTTHKSTYFKICSCCLTPVAYIVLSSGNIQQTGKEYLTSEITSLE